MVKSVADRFFEKVDVRSLDECWLWIASVDKDGYGQFGIKKSGRNTMAKSHRWSWEYLHGPIPDKLTVDHKCHNEDLFCLSGPSCPHRRCVNPWHLEPVTIEVNTSRAADPDRHTRCRAGHEYTEENSYYRKGYKGHIYRECKTCRWLAKQRMKVN